MVETAEIRQIRTGSNNDELVKQRRLHLIKCATSVLVKQGFQKTRMIDVAKACGVSYGASYHYIGSKDDVLFLIIDFATTEGVKRVEAIRERVAGCKQVEALRESIKAYLQHVDELQDMLIVINHVMVDLPRKERERVFNAEDRVVGHFDSLLREGIKTGEFSISDPSFVAFNLVALAQNWAHRRWFLRKRYTLEQYADKLAQTVLNDILASNSQVARKI